MTKQQFIGGKRPDNTTWKIKLHLPPFTVPDQDVTAVAGFCFQSGNILVVENPRGWDIPGGHLEPDETPVEALIRELSEEASFTVIQHVPIAYLESDYYLEHKSFMIIYTVEGTKANFAPSAEISACRFMAIEDFLWAYSGGNKELMKFLVAIAQSNTL